MRPPSFRHLVEGGRCSGAWAAGTPVTRNSGGPLCVPCWAPAAPWRFVAGAPGGPAVVVWWWGLGTEDFHEGCREHLRWGRAGARAVGNSPFEAGRTAGVVGGGAALWWRNGVDVALDRVEAAELIGR
ncbi:hypothetical protein CYMTET_20399 [Cymbomonas tetramitiformis]|uniref:Uncharacterized protein n=1 Tax=Cymbomonas tetramitiformis TaxID=36881 RepID=A0AAE0G424_9CHLO|nr:hypothetical protein CYMTET_20399 [Cymbomonas tetramitiformis]